MDDLFADGVGEITVINGVARLSLIALETPPGAREAGETKPVAVIKRRLAMPVAGLVNLVQQSQALLQRMEQAGAAQRQAAEGQKPATGASPSSPNF